MKYFQHDISTLANEKIRKVVRTHGPTGYAIWWALLERLYGAEEKGFQIEARELWLENLAESLCISDYRTLIRVFDTFASVGLISSQLWAEHVIFCEAILDRGNAYVQKKAKEREKKQRQRQQGGAVPRGQDGDALGTRGQNAIVPPVDIDLELEQLTDLSQKETNLSSASATFSGEATPRTVESVPVPVAIAQTVSPAVATAEPAPDSLAKPQSKPEATPLPPSAVETEFEGWWKGWIEFCKFLGMQRCSMGDKQEAKRRYQEQAKKHGVEAIAKGTAAFIRSKRTEHEQNRGRCVNPPHACRFLHGKKEHPTPYWLEALEAEAEARKPRAQDVADPAWDEWAIANGYIRQVLQLGGARYVELANGQVRDYDQARRKYPHVGVGV